MLPQTAHRTSAASRGRGAFPGPAGLARLAALAGLVAAGLAGCGGRDLERDHVTGQTAAAIAATPALELPGPRPGHDLTLRVVYPTKRGHYPLVILTGGSGTADGSYARLADHWASRGYVVAQLGVAPGDGADPAAAADGVPDVRSVLDSLAVIEKRIPALRHSIDRTHVAVAGHDAGASTALALGDPAHDEPRITAIILIGELARPEAPGATAWLATRKPTFLLVGTRERPPAVRRPIAPPAPGAAAAHFRLEVRDLDRCLGNLLCRSARNEPSGPPDYAALSALEDTSTAFLDAYLRRDGAALIWLARADRPDLVNGRGRLTAL